MKIVMAVVAVVLAGCATTTQQSQWKDWGVCLEHGIIDAQNCDAAYDSGNFPPKGSSLRAPEPVMVAQIWDADALGNDPLYAPLYESPRQRHRDNPFLNGQYQRDQQIQDQERRLGDLERQQQIERSNRFFERGLRGLRY